MGMDQMTGMHVKHINIIITLRQIGVINYDHFCFKFD